MTKQQLEKKVDEFVNRYSGKEKGYPTDSYYQGECLSIVKIYIKEVFGINPPPSGSNSAFGYWSNFPDPLGTIFERVPLSANEKPFKGCIPIWSTNVGLGYGHIDIFLSGDNNGFNGFDQNWDGRKAHIQGHTWGSVVGYLKPKLEEIKPEPLEITLSTKIPPIDNKEVQQIIAELDAKDRRIYDLENQLDSIGKKKESECDERVKVLGDSLDAEHEVVLSEVKKINEDQIRQMKLEYEKLLIKKVKDLSAGALFNLALKKLFGLA